ncbi:MAG: flagellar hook-length control protein FliK [Lachnospiraceae bacterium]|nr:flagellar hook-length control protein FliK [Lachnospiraceae bacterium]
MIVNPSTELFFTTATKSVSGNLEKSNSISFQDCMKDKVAGSKNTKNIDDTLKNSTEKSDYKRDSYKDSSSRVKKSEQNENQDVKELSKDDLEKMSDEMKDKIMDKLSVSEDELEEIMSALNLSWMDLLNPDKLQMLVLACEGKGQVDLLTDENLNQCLQDILGDLKELLNDYGTDFEQLESSIQSLDTGDFEEVLAETKDATANEPEIEIDNENVANDVVKTERTQENPGEKALDDTSSDKEKSFHSEEKTKEPLKMETEGKEQITTVVQQQDFKQTVTTVRETDTQGVVSQVITQVKVMVTEDTNSLQMQLYPEHLGKLSIQVSEKSGVMSAQLIVESEDAKQALVSSMNELKDAFQEQNLKISEIEVSVAPKSFEQQEQSSNGQAQESKKSGKSGTRNLRLDDLLDDEVEELMEEEKIAVEMMQLSGSSVDFSA